MSIQLYQLYTTHSLNLYREYCSDFILTQNKVPNLLMDEQFLTENDTYFWKGIESYYLREPDEKGNINLVIRYVDDCDDKETITFCLVPVKIFI